MSIKISGTTVIDDSRNLSSVGIATVGSGSSAVIINGDSGVTNVGSAVTVNGITGDIVTSGIFTCASFSVPVSINSFTPANNATGQEVDVDISIKFNQTIGYGATGYAQLRSGSTSGTVLETFYRASPGIDIIDGATTLKIIPSSNFEYSTDIFVIMTDGFITANGGDFEGINVAGSTVTYDFTTRALQPGDPTEGGYLVCAASSTYWIVAPSSTECRATHGTATSCSRQNAQTASGCGGWFTPSVAQLQNPGFACRQYWDSYTAADYWTNQITRWNGQAIQGRYQVVRMGNGSSYDTFGGDNTRARAFRTVAY